jgi:hypothetical protein
MGKTAFSLFHPIVWPENDEKHDFFIILGPKCFNKCKFLAKKIEKKGLG